jgi:hypothetical protein
MEADRQQVEASIPGAQFSAPIAEPLFILVPHRVVSGLPPRAMKDPERNVICSHIV